MKHKGDRETSFIDKNVNAWLEENRETNGLCLKRFHADFVVDLEGLRVGDMVEFDSRNADDVAEIDSQNTSDIVVLSSQNAGEVAEMQGDGNVVQRQKNGEQKAKTVGKYEITSIGKRCFAECELLKEKGEPCPLKMGVAFGKSI